MKVKYLVLDFGMVLAYPITGEWFITPKLNELVNFNKIDRNKLLKAMLKNNRFLNSKMVKLEEEQEMFYHFYKNSLDEINIKNSNEIAQQVAYDFTYEDNKYKFYKGVKDELERLSKKYTILMLSDNWPCANKLMKNAEIYDYFDKIYISSVYGSRKQDKIFFDYLINDYNVKKGQAIFVDDNEMLLDIAKEKGFITKRMNREKYEMKSKHTIINNLKNL